MHRKSVLWSAVIVGSIVLTPLAPAQAQSRTNSQDTTNLTQNLEKDAQSFQPLFNGAIKRSVIRDTSQETSATQLVARFVEQTDAMAANKSDAHFTPVLETATQINRLVYDLMLDIPATDDWAKIRDDLHQIASAEGVPDPVNEDGVAFAPPLANDVPCATTLAPDRVTELVDECKQVSSGTQSACNARRSCTSIVSEVKSGCGSVGSGSQPVFCEDYR